VSQKMTTSMDVTATVNKNDKKEEASSKKVEGEETCLRKKTKAHSPKETPVKVDSSSSSRVRRRNCEAEFGKVDDNPGVVPEVPIEKAPGYNDEIAETVVEEKEAEKEETPKKRKKDLRETAIGRFITKTFCAKSED